DFVIAFEEAEKGFALNGRLKQAREFRGVEIAGFEREGLAGTVAKAFEFNDAAFRWKRKACGGCVFIVDGSGNQYPCAGSKRARCHLFGVAHEFVEMDFRRRHERPDAAAALDQTLAFEERQRVARGH